MHDKMFRNFIFLSVVSISTSVGFAISNTSTLEIISSPQSSIKIDGDSTVRKYSAQAKPVTIRVQAKLNSTGTSGPTAKFPWIPEGVELTLPTASLTSGERTLDKHMQENLKAEKFPEIKMKLSHFNFDSTTRTAKVKGDLTVAGVTKTIELEPTYSIDGQKVSIKGKKRLLMSEFGITPPILMMGTLKTKDEIDVSYDIELLPNSAPKKDAL